MSGFDLRQVQVLQELGYSDGAIERMVADRAVRIAD
jgi:hypothetical protein